MDSYRWLAGHNVKLDVRRAIDSVSGGATSWGSVGGTLSDQTDLQTALDAKQDDLVSGTNIKTINGATVLGSGDLTVSGSGIDRGVAYTVMLGNFMS